MMPNQGLQGQGVFLPNQDVKYTHKQEIDQPGEKISFVEKVKQKFRHWECQWCTMILNCFMISKFIINKKVIM